MVSICDSSVHLYGSIYEVYTCLKGKQAHTLYNTKIVIYAGASKVYRQHCVLK